MSITRVHPVHPTLLLARLCATALAITAAITLTLPRPAGAQAAGPGAWRSTASRVPQQIERLRANLARATALRAERGVSPSATVPGPALDAWQGNGTLVCTSAFGQISPSLAPDAAGGAFVVFQDFRNLSVDLFINRLDSNGNFAAGWSGAGFEVAVRDSYIIEPQVVTDGAGGVYVGFSEYDLGAGGYLPDVFVQRILPTGAIAGGWPAAGKALNLGDNDGFQIQADSTGGLLVGWLDPVAQGRVVRLDNAGNVVSGWPASGVAVGPANANSIQFCADGTGGFYAAWTSTDTVYVVRYGSGGSVAPGWSAGGNLASTGGFFTGDIAITRLTSGDVMVGWTDFRFADVDLFAVRMTSGGGFATGWSSGGVAVCTATGALSEPYAISDNNGGAVFFWTDLRGLPSFIFYAQRITASGGISAGWTVDGLGMCLGTTTKFSETIVGDASGGLYVGWSDDTGGGSGNDIYAQCLQGSGARPAAYPADGLVVCGADAGQYSVRMTSDAAGGAILAWEDDRDMLGPTRVYAAHIRSDGTAAHASLASALAEPGRVRLLWYSPDGAGFSARLERATGAGGFTVIADLHADGSGYVRYEDLDVVPGATYRYRLVADGGAAVLGEVELRIPESLALALEPARPNPTAGPLTLAFVLPTAAPATLELIDVGGRRVVGREVAGAGRQVLRLDERLAPGVYLVRLAQAGRSVTGRVVVTE